MSLQVDIEKKLKDITLKIAFETRLGDGIHGILGASGCGKSMTLKCIAGILTPDRGRIVLNGTVLFDSEKGIDLKIQKRNVGYLFQNYALFPHMTVGRNVEIAARGRTPAEKRETAAKYMELLQVRELEHNDPGRLSGGQQQRVALARILASGPDVLMLDEPFSALDFYLKESIQLDLKQVLAGYHGDILMVTHSRDEIYRFCQKIHVLDQGKLVVSGDTRSVFQNPQMVAAAKLTGCKNIVRAKKLNGHEVEVKEWNTRLYFEREVPDGFDHIGIRAHYFCKKESGNESNVIPCRPKQILEDLFEVIIVTENGIWWKIPKEEWKERYGQQVPDEMVVLEDRVLFLRE